MRTPTCTLFAFCLAVLSTTTQAQSNSAITAQPHDRVLQAIDEGISVALPGNVHPLVTRTPAQATARNLPMEHMVLTLKGDAAQESALEQLIAAQQDPKSPQYHKFLTPAQFGAQFGASANDIQKIASWLTASGFRVDEIPAGRRAIVFSGTSEDVASTFKTPIATYIVSGATHHANVQDPQIPAALSGVVSGIVRLHDFQHHTNGSPKAAISHPDYTYGSNHYLSPADYATIYDINALYGAGINGNGQSIAIMARSDISLADVQAFRQSFGLPANNPAFVYVSTDPGTVSGDTDETTLDTEWSGAVAPNAAVKVVIGASTSSADGIDLAAQYAVNNNVAHIISLSYGECEAYMGSGGMNFYNSLWQQAAAEGITVLVSAGDSGAAGCDYGGSSTGTVQAVNGLCSSPYSTCVGGTEFADTSNPGQYWLSGNNSVYGSAISYIPEGVWNDSGPGGGLWAGGGGASIVFKKPSWQTGPGVPADGARDVPDVSMTASTHDGYIIVEDGSMWVIGGTSASAPSFAGLMALVGQKTNSAQGDVNPTLYPLAINQAAGGAAVFHDITAGNNSVPGVTGFNADAGYDRASGLGSVDAALLVNHWNDAANTNPSLTLTTSSSSVTDCVGQSAQVTLTSWTSNLSTAVALSVSGAPANLTAKLGAATIASPGSGSVSLQISAAANLTPGTYPLTVTAAGGGKTATVTITVTVPTPTFTLAAASQSVSVGQSSQTQTSLTVAAQNGFSSAVALSVSGLPNGVTAAFAPATLTTGAGVSTLTISATATAKTGTYPLTITATAGSITQKATLNVTVSVPASCTLTANPSSVTLTAGQPQSATVTCGSVQGVFSSALTYSVTGQPTGVTATFAQAQVNAGSAATLNLSADVTKASAGSFKLTVSVTQGTFTKSVTMPVTVIIPPPTFALSATSTSLSVQQGSQSQTVLTVTPQNNFKSAVAFSVTGQPAGVTATFAPATLTTGSGSGTLTLAASSTAKTGTYPLTVSATGGGITQKATINLTIAVPPSCTLSVNPSALTLVAGQAQAAAVTCGSVQGTFAAPLAYSVTGQPAGVTATFAQSQTAAGSAATLNLSADPTQATAGSFNLTVSATQGTFSKSVTLPVTLQIPASGSLTLSPAAAALTVKPGTSVPLALGAARTGGFAPAVSIGISGTASGITATLSSTTLGATGAFTVTFTATSSAPAGTYNYTVNLTGGNKSFSIPVSLTVASTPSFTSIVNTNAITIQAGGASAPLTVSNGNYVNGFDATITLALTGLPAGMSYSFVSGTAANNFVNITYAISAAATTAPGTYPITVSATGGGNSYKNTVYVTVTAPASSAKH